MYSSHFHTNWFKYFTLLWIHYTMILSLVPVTFPFWSYISIHSSWFSWSLKLLTGSSNYLLSFLELTLVIRMEINSAPVSIENAKFSFQMGWSPYWMLVYYLLSPHRMIFLYYDPFYRSVPSASKIYRLTWLPSITP